MSARTRVPEPTYSGIKARGRGGRDLVHEPPVPGSRSARRGPGHPVEMARRVAGRSTAGVLKMEPNMTFLPRYWPLDKEYPLSRPSGK
jgi:hypothetical protein